MIVPIQWPIILTMWLRKRKEAAEIQCPTGRSRGVRQSLRRRRCGRNMSVPQGELTITTRDWTSHNGNGPKDCRKSKSERESHYS